MIWFGIGLELVLVGIILVIWWREKRRGLLDEKDRLHLLQIAGRYIAEWIQLPTAKREKNQIYQIVCRLAGEEEGKEMFRKYRQKRWSVILGTVLLFNAFLIGKGILLDQQEEVVFATEQSRPEYGEGDVKEEVTVILNGEEEAQSTISLRIPEREISEKEAQDRVRKGIQYIQEAVKDIKIKGDISLPAGWNGVTFYYESLSPNLLSNNGGWVGKIQDSPQTVELRVTASLANQNLTETVTLTTATLSELSAEERLSMIMAKVQEGDFLTEDKLILPSVTETGEELQWIEKEESRGIVWILSGVILILFVLWKQDLEYKQLVKERDQRIKQVYPEFLNELVIMLGAGLSLPAAWKRISQDYQKKREEGYEINPLYEEICRGSKAMEAGASMREILEEFTAHMRLKEARRFAVLLVQNLKRGDAFLISRLKELNQEAWDLRKRQVREKTEEADTKLLLPLMLMLAVILIIVLSPAMITMQV